MKFSSILSAKSLVLTGTLIFGTAGIVHAQGYDQGGSTQKPYDSTQSGTSGGGSDYGTKGDDQKSGMRAISAPLIIPGIAPMVLKDMTIRTRVRERTVQVPNSKAGTKEPLTRPGLLAKGDDSFAGGQERRGSAPPLPLPIRYSRAGSILQSGDRTRGCTKIRRP